MKSNFFYCDYGKYKVLYLKKLHTQNFLSIYFNSYPLLFQHGFSRPATLLRFMVMIERRVINCIFQLLLSILSSKILSKCSKKKKRKDSYNYC